MQGGNIRAAINVDLNLGDALGEINKLKSGLKQLKIPANATKGFENSLDSLVAEMQKFDSLNKNIKPGDKTGMNALEKSYQNILKLAQKVDAEMASMGSKGKSLISDSDLAKMNKLNEAMKEQKQLQSQIDSKKKAISQQEQKRKEKESKFTDKINKNQALAQDRNKKANKILNDSKTVKEYVKALENQAKAEKQLKDAKNSGSDQEKEQAKKQLEEANKRLEAAEKKKNQYDKNDKYGEYKQLKAEEARALKDARAAQTGLDKEQMSGGEINKIIQDIEKLKGELKSLESTASLDKIRAEFASLAGVPVENVTTDIEQLNSEIKSLQTNKIEQLKASLDQLGNSSGINKLNQDLRKGQQQLNQYRGEFDKLTMKQRDADDMKYRLTNFFSWSEGLNLIKRGAREAFRAVKDLDDAMTGTAVVTDFSVSDLWDMLPKYTDTANKLGATVQGAYETMTLYYQQGLDTEAAFGMGTETMKMSRIADMDYVEGTDLMTAAIRGFHMDLTETSAKWVNDVYSELAAISASDTHEIATAMTKTASIADSANAEFDTTAAFLTQMIETTREAPETAGTALKTIIARFQELKKAPEEISDVDGEAVDANKIEAALRTIDVDLRDTTGQFRDFDDVILEISDKWDSLDTNTQRYIATVAAGARQQSRFIALVADNERLTELVEGAQNSAGASDKQFEKTMESLTAKLNMLKNAYHEFLMGILDSNIIKGGVDALTGLFNVLNNLADMTGPLSGLVKVLTAIGMFMGGRALVMNGISAISGGLTNVIAAGTAAGGGAGAAGVAAAMAASKEQREEDKKQKKASKKAGTMLGAGKQAFLGTAAGQLFSSAFGNLSGLMKGDIDAKTFGAKAKAGAKGMGSNALGLLGALAFGTGIDAASLSKDIDQKRLDLDATDNERKRHIIQQDIDRLENEKNAKGLKKRSMALNKIGTGAAGALASVVDVLGAIPGPAMAVAAALALVVGAFAINAKIEQDRIDKMNELVTQHDEAKQAYQSNKAALSSLETEYNNLSKGVNRYGENIGLSAEQFERYQEITQEIADISPEAVESVDIEGNIILKPDAIEKALEAVEYDMELQNAAFSSESGLSTLMAGINHSTEDIKNNYTEAQGQLDSFFRDNALTAGDFNKTGFTDFDPTRNANYEISGFAGTSVLRDDVKRDTSDLEELYQQRYDILKDAKESLTEIAEEYGTESDEYKDAVSDYYNLQSLIDQGGQLQEELKAERAPIIESLKTFADSDMNLEATGVQSLAEKVSKDNQALFNKFIEDTGLNEDLSATQMHDYVEFASEKLSSDNEFGKKVADEFDAITEAKDNFDESAKDTKAVEEYNEAISDSVENMESYIQELREEGTAEANALADSLEAQLAELESYAQEAKMTVSDAFNDLQDEIAEANKAKEKYDAAIAEGDYYTGRQNFKAIYEDMTSDVNYAGEGSQSFWAGAEMMLDPTWLRQYASDASAVKKELAHWKPMLQDGAAGAHAFMNELYNLEDLENYGIFKDRNGFALDFSEWDDKNLDDLAEALGITDDLLASMLNNARQFTNIEFSNVESVKKAMADAGLGVEDSKGKIAVSYSALQQQSGLSIHEFADWAELKEVKDSFNLLNYQASTDSDLVTFRRSMENAFSGVFTNYENRTTNSIEDVSSIDLTEYIAAAYASGATSEEAIDLLGEFSDRGIKIQDENGREVEDYAKAVEDGFEEINVADPLTNASDSMNNAATAMMALVAILGGGMDTKASKAARAEAKKGYEGQYDIGTKNGTIDDFQEWTDSDWANYEEDKANAEAQRQAAKVAMDNAKDPEAKADAEHEYNAWGKHIGAMENAAEIQNASNGDIVTIGGERFEVQKTTDRNGNTTTRFVDSEGRTMASGEFANRDSMPVANKETPTLGEKAANVGNKVGDFLGELFTDAWGFEDKFNNWAKGLFDKNKDKKETSSTERGREVSKQNVEEKTGIEIDTVIKDEDKVNNFLDTINGLSEEEYEVVLNALTEAAQGNVEGFMEIIGGLPLDTQCQIISLLTGTPPEVVEQELNALAGTETEITTDADAQGAISELTTVNALATVFAGGASASFTASGLSSIIAQLRTAINLKNQLKSGGTAKGANAPKPGKIQGFRSMAKGGKIGPNGKGGMTLTGELGPELVWLPDQSTSFLTGVGGPQMVPLPNNAVVYTHEQTKDIMNSNRGLPEFGTASGGWNPSDTGGGSGTPTSSTGSSNRSSAGTEEEKWKNEIDWLYNLLEDINEVIRDREKLEHRYERLLEQRNASLSDLIELQDAQFENLRTQKKLEEERLEKRKQEMREYIKENADISNKYGIKFNENDMTIEIDWEAIDAITDEKEGEKVNDMISRLEEIQDEIDKAEDSLMEIEELVDEIEARGKEEYFDLEERVIDALEAIAEREIDRVNEISDAISDSQSKLLDSIQKSIDKQRQERDNQKTEDNLGDMRRRLAYLRQDTSGMNALEIKQLEEQLKEEEEAYGDTLVDQKLQEMQEQNDEASAQRERQIAIMEEQLNFNKESGVFAQQARDLILDARNKLNEGIALEKTQLYQIISSGENWQADSWAKQLENWDELLVGTAQALAYLDNRENRDYMAEMQEWFKVLNDPNSSEDDKAMARSKIAILEKQRNAKIIEEGLEDQYPTTGTMYTQIAYDSASSNYMADMQNAFNSGDRAAIAEAEKMRNTKLVMMGRENEQTNFLGAYDRAQVTIAGTGDEKLNLDTDYSTLMNDALKKGDFETALYYELLRDAKIAAKGWQDKYPATNGSITWEAFQNWTPSVPNEPVVQEKTYGKVSETSGNITVTASSSGDIVGRIIYALKKMGMYNGEVTDKFDSTSFTAFKQFLKDARLISNVNGTNSITIGKNVRGAFAAKGYLRGGLADYTGPAWLDGTPSKPELVLNARDTENFIQLKDILADLRGFRGKASQADRVGDTYYDVQINVDKISNDYDVEKMAEKIKKIIHKDSMYRNVNAINFLR